MSKSKEENPITNRFLVLKEMYKGDSPIDIDLFDILSTSLINTLGELTTRGVIEIEGLHIDKWKDRVEETSRFVDFELQETKDPTVYFDLRIKENIPYASPIQVYLECSAGDKREKETAEQVREAIFG